MTYRHIFEEGKSALALAGITEAELDARLLLEFVCGTDRNTLLVHGDREVAAEAEKAYLELIKRRAARIPLQHLTGIQSFMGLDFEVNEHVLIPRQDTEILVEEALRELHDGMRVLDMCTGSGCILISLLHYSNDCTGVGADISVEALEVAKRNAKRLLGSEACGEERLSVPAEACSALPAGDADDGDCPVKFIQSNLFEGVEGQFDMLVSNPPYIRTDVIETLEPEVREHEPMQALDGFSDGLYFYRKIVGDSPRFLKKGGMLFFEIGYNQASAVSRLMEEAGYLEVRVIQDYAGLDRVVCGTLQFD